MKEIMKPLLFAYGSMKKGFRNHYRLENDKFIGRAKTKKKYCIYPAPSYNYPYGIENDHKWQLKGELYELTNTPIETIDEFEGSPAYYYRTMIKAVCNDKEYDAYIYFKSDTNPNNVEYDIPLDEWTLEFQEVGCKQDEMLQALANAIKSKRSKS